MTETETSEAMTDEELQELVDDWVNGRLRVVHLDEE